MYKGKCLYFYYSFIISISLCCNSIASKCELKCCENDQAVKNFQEYVKIDTSGEKNLRHVVTFLEHQAAELGLPISVYYPDGKPIFVITWIGGNSSLPSIMLNSHADVVSADEKFWRFPPYSGHIDENCNIYGRGTQDTKGVTIQYLEAIRILMQSNVTLERTLHVTVMPDEETGGFHGIKPFIKTKDFSALNIGFALDEGLTSANDDFYVSYQDKRAWQMKFTVFGEAGHGSGMPNSSAMEKMYKLISIIMKFRREQNELGKTYDSLDFGRHTSVNINAIAGGSVPNVIPSEVSAVVDMRLAVDADVEAVQALVESWRIQAGNDTLLEFIRRDVLSAATPLQSNSYWQAMVQTATDIGITLKPIVIPATSDILVLRNEGIPALGFAPRNRTPPRLHANNEYLNVEVFLKGIDTKLGKGKQTYDCETITGTNPSVYVQSTISS